MAIGFIEFDCGHQEVRSGKGVRRRSIIKQPGLCTKCLSARGGGQKLFKECGHVLPIEDWRDVPFGETHEQEGICLDCRHLALAKSQLRTVVAGEPDSVRREREAKGFRR